MTRSKFRRQSCLCCHRKRSNMDVFLPGTPIPRENETFQSKASIQSEGTKSTVSEKQQAILPLAQLQRSDHITELSFHKSKLETSFTSKRGSNVGSVVSIPTSSVQGNDTTETGAELKKPGSLIDILSRKTPTPIPTGSFDKERNGIDTRPTTASSSKSTSSSSRSRTSLSSRSTKSSLGSFDGRLSSIAAVEHLKDEDSSAMKLLSLDYFENKDKKFLCVSCGLILQYPVQLSHCEHNVCSSCLTDLDKSYAKCPLDGKKIIRKEVKINRDMTKKLKKQLISCPMTDIGCNWKGMLGEFKVHFDICDCKQELCPNGCGMMVARKSMKMHTDRECVKRHVMCRFCVRAVRAEVEIEHIKICPRFPLSCPKNCGEKEIPREEMDEHLKDKCRFRQERCPYQKLGCTFSGVDEDIQLHLISESNQHTSFVREKLSNLVQLVENHSKSIRLQEEILEDQTKKLRVLNRIYGNQMLWKIDEWAKRKADAISGKKLVLRSPPFYTGKYEYKLALSLLPNGDGSAKSRYMSLYIAVCKGEYDALLRWPFRMTVTLSLVDQCQNPLARKDHTYTIKPNPCDENAPFLGRPKTGPNLSFGAQNFILCETLSTRDYVRDDILFIRVRVKEEL